MLGWVFFPLQWGQLGHPKLCRAWRCCFCGPHSGWARAPSPCWISGNRGAYQGQWLAPGCVHDSGNGSLCLCVPVCLFVCVCALGWVLDCTSLSTSQPPPPGMEAYLSPISPHHTASGWSPHLWLYWWFSVSGDGCPGMYCSLSVAAWQGLTPVAWPGPFWGVEGPQFSLCSCALGGL